MWKKDEEANFLSRTSPNAFCWKRFAYVALNMGNDFHKVKNVLEIGCADGCNLYPYHVNGKLVEGYDYGKEYLDVGKNIGASLQADQAEADLRVAQAKAETRRAMAVADEQEMQAKVVEAESEVPKAMSQAFREGNLGIFDYYNMNNIKADTGMRDSIADSSSPKKDHSDDLDHD